MKPHSLIFSLTTAGLATVALPCAAAVGPAAIGHAAEVVHGGDFTSCVTLVGSATRLQQGVRLTPALQWQAGAAWDCHKRLIEGGFEIGFRFRLTDGGGYIEPGDGFAFVIQNASLAALGSAGLGIGYDGIRNSVAIEFDTWYNVELDDPNNNHISVHAVLDTPKRKINSAHETYSIGSTGDIPIPDVSDGAIHRVVIRYVPDILEIYLDDFTEPVLELAADLSTILELDGGKAWLGFTASTGAAWENHDILNYRFID